MSESKSSSGATSGGGSCAGLMTIVFVVLKMNGVIDWAWLWVLSPLWISAIIAVAAMIVVFGILGIVLLFQR